MMAKLVFSYAEAMRILDEQAKERDLAMEKHRKAEADYWRKYFNEDRVEELEDVLRTLLRLHDGGVGSGDEWEHALATAHKVLDEEDGLQTVAKGGAS